MPDYRAIQHPCATAYTEDGGVFEFKPRDYAKLRQAFLEKHPFFEGTGIDGDSIVIALDVIVAVGLETEVSVDSNNQRAIDREQKRKVNELFE